MFNWSLSPAVSWLRRSDSSKPNLNMGDVSRRSDNSIPSSISERGHLFYIDAPLTLSDGNTLNFSFAAAEGYETRVISRELKTEEGDWEIRVIEGAEFSGGSVATIQGFNRSGRSANAVIKQGVTIDVAGITILNDAVFAGQGASAQGITDISDAPFIFDPSKTEILQIKKLGSIGSSKAIIRIAFAEIPDEEL